MTLYILTSGDPRHYPFSNKAYTDKDMAEHEAFNLRYSGNYKVKEIEVPFAGKYLYWMHVYYGFTYDWPGMHDVCKDSDVYPCKAYLNEDPLCKEILNRIKNDGAEKYAIGFNSVNEPYMASKLSGDFEFIHGEACDGNFRATYMRIKVVRQTYEQYHAELNKLLHECGY